MMWQQILQNMSQQTQWFIVAILVFTVYFHLRFTPENAHKSPAFLTTLGILGTFVGIGIGLLQFDPGNVQKSVPALIDGIKTAVWASACGILCALTIKLRDIVFTRRSYPGRKSTGKAVDDMIASLHSIERLLAGKGELSLLQQMKRSAQENKEQLAAIHGTMEHFYDKMAESNVRALVQALNEVMRDFNVKLNEQFGDNFKRLNESVEKMLLWQQHYAEQIGQVIDQYHAASDAMTMVSKRYRQMLDNTEIFNTVAHSLSEMLQGLESQRRQIEESLRQLAQLIKAAAEGMPQIEQRITGIVQQLGSGMQAVNTEFNTHVRAMIAGTKEQVLALDTALSEELTKALDSFGRQLASLSQKFAEDYTPITERLQAVLKIAG